METFKTVLKYVAIFGGWLAALAQNIVDTIPSM